MLSLHAVCHYPLRIASVSSHRRSRLHQTCVYEPIPTSPSPSTASALANQPHEDIGEGFTTADIKAAIIQRLSESAPEVIGAAYYCGVRTWLPIICTENICRRLPKSWEIASADFCFLFLTISLLGTIPKPEHQEGTLPPDLKLLYFQCKCWMAGLEGQGHNSLDLTQVRLFITLFEIGRGIYPAAYISVGALVRSMDALSLFTESNSALEHSETDKQYQEECERTWRAVLVADRYFSLRAP